MCGSTEYRPVYDEVTILDAEAPSADEINAAYDSFTSEPTDTYQDTVATFFEQVSEPTVIERLTAAVEDAAGEITDLKGQVTDLEAERDRLETQIRELEEDQPDFSEVIDNLRFAAREIDNLRAEVSDAEERVGNLRYSDLEDVMNDLDDISFSSVESSIDDASAAVDNAVEELERYS